MLRKFIFLFIGVFSALFSKPVEFPQVIDFGSFDLRPSYAGERGWQWYLRNANYQSVLGAFNGAPEFGAFFAFLKNEYHIDIVIETGTHLGNTTQFLATCFPEVHTIEIMETHCNRAKEIFKSQPNVHCHLGSSEKVLSELLPSLIDKPIVFYLDAHWYDYWPLVDEIEEIAKTHKNNCVIVIDDFKVPGRNDLAYDAYVIDGILHECSYEYIKAHMEKAFTDYNMHFLLPKNAIARAKFVAVPKKMVLRS